ncbi:MAG TPA: hypothetical protein VGM88_26050 [Kofleriaceae bacterium]|jgi:hypothetical protein
MVHVVGFVVLAAASAVTARIAYAVWARTAALHETMERMEAMLACIAAVPAAAPGLVMLSIAPPDPEPVAEPAPAPAPAPAVEVAPEEPRTLAEGSRNIAVERLSGRLDEQLLRFELGKRRVDPEDAPPAKTSRTVVIPPRR